MCIFHRHNKLSAINEDLLSVNWKHFNVSNLKNMKTELLQISEFIPSFLSILYLLCYSLIILFFFLGATSTIEER